ncbi:MAG TPA: 4-hydroxyphenylacetate 3-hydroxylase N-terminal domain-containing protein, partial [Dehalococcoidia bacterium]|nr:4-hydroxyphenylacetate 3-hydroxylase N-terminal domain-containing protein [Dehalococcoidia bacterium]
MPARTGAQYLATLKDHSPEVWIGADRVRDVTTHPATRGAAAEFARLYDLQHDARYRDFALFPSPKTGELVSTQFLLPRSVEDWRQRRQLHKLWADATFGGMGRTTDFMAAMIAGWYVSADHFGEYAGNVRTYFEFVRDNDLFLTHTLIDPPVDRSKPPSRQADEFTYLGAVRETDQGLIVRGAKMLATACPFADELLVWSFSFSLGQYGPEDAKYILGFAIPCTSPGLRFISREPYGIGRNRFDHPLSSRFDELDGVAVFDDVLVPWERVFIYRDIDKVKRMYQTAMAAFSAHQTGIRFWSKLELLAGLAKSGSALLRTDHNLHIQDMIAEMTTLLELTKSVIIAAEAQAET